ncbi:acyl-CoA dehydrogenase [Streptomyces sp. NPDC028635]|uniref:acyl-CoA dehydrogenase n=1 Tax=Streptomyces sp. NPDC028635 TaxID=3154800 RepID=UPI0033F276B3
MPGTRNGTPPADAASLLERRLGDPEDPATMLSYARVLDADRHETFPADPCGLLDLWGLPDHYVPAEHGGQLTDYQQLAALVRTVAGRDLTTAVVHTGTFFGSACVWASGDDEAARRLAALVREGHSVALALSERHHDDDPITTDVTAWPVADGFLLNGEKALVPGAARARVLCLLARTGPDSGPRAYSVLLVDKRTLSGGRCVEAARTPTEGVRGADLSGVLFTDVVAPAGSLVGAQGQGGEIVLKGLQLVRGITPALSAGAAGNALHLALSAIRESSGPLPGALADVPLTRRILGECAADLLAVDALATVTARSVHLLPRELSVTSAAAAYLVPAVVGEVLARLVGLFPQRTGAPALEMLRKAERDHRTVRVLGGSDTAHLYALAAAFRHLARRAGARGAGVDPAVYDPGAPLPPPRPGDLALVPRDGSALLAALPGLARELAETAATTPALAGAARVAQELGGRAERLRAALPPAVHTLSRLPAASAEQARQVAVCLAASACLGMWRHAPVLEGRWPDGLWLEPALRRLLRRLGGADTDMVQDGPGSGGRGFDALADRVADLWAHDGAPCALVPPAGVEGAA